MGSLGLTGAGAIAGAASGLLQSGIGATESYMNWKQQERLFKWQKKQQKMTWAREDTAYQRKMADLQAAGLNPTLAVGGPGSPSGPIAPSRAPQIDMASKAMMAMNAMSMRADISKTLAEKKLLDKRSEYQSIVNKYEDTQRDAKTVQEVIKAELAVELKPEAIKVAKANAARAGDEAVLSRYRQWKEKFDYETWKQIETLKNQYKLKIQQSGIPFAKDEAELTALLMTNEFMQNDAQWATDKGLPTKATASGPMAVLWALIEGIDRLTGGTR